MAPVAVATYPGMSPQEAHTRHSRWRFFQIAFAFTYLGILLDVVTTALGSSKAGSLNAYEQNPLGSILVGNLGWIGLLAAMTVLCLVAYTSFRVVYTRIGLRWIRLFNWFVLLISAVRWLAVVTSIMYLVHTAG